MVKRLGQREYDPDVFCVAAMTTRVIRITPGILRILHDRCGKMMIGTGREYPRSSFRKTTIRAVLCERCSVRRGQRPYSTRRWSNGRVETTSGGQNREAPTMVGRRIDSSCILCPPPSEGGSSMRKSQEKMHPVDRSVRRLSFHPQLDRIG